MKRLWQFIILSFLATIIIACNTKPRDVLNEKKMVAVFQDMYIANGVFIDDKDSYRADSMRDALINGVLEKHGVTQTQFDSSLMWYADKIETFTTIQDAVSAELQKKVDAMTLLSEANAYSFKLAGFDYDLPSYYVLDNDNPTFAFRLDSVQVESIEKEKFNFHFTIQGVDTLRHNIDAIVYFKYTSDTTIVAHKELIAGGYYEFDVPNPFDDHSSLKEIFSYVHMLPKNGNLSKIYLNNIDNRSVEKDSITFVNDTTKVQLTQKTKD